MMSFLSIAKPKGARREGTGHGKNGYPIVLTSSRSEISRYSGDPFGAFIATFPKNVIPRTILREEWFKPDDAPDGSARFMPYGLRKVESILKDEFGESNVIAVHPDNLDKVIGPKTKVLGISSMDPMGSAYVSFTYNSLLGLGGASVDELEFKKVVNHPSIKKYKPKVIVGGAGAWQIRDSRKVDEYGIDCLVHGLAEPIITDIFKQAMEGNGLSKEVYSKRVPEESIPIIKRASSYGVVEITRGCGRGCQFCSPTNRTKFSLPKETIMKEVAVNVKGGSDSVFTATEDMFLYKCGPKYVPNRKAVVDLYESIASYPGVNYIHLSHCSLAPVVYDDKLLEEITPCLMEKTRYTPKFRRNYPRPFVTSLFGIESGSRRIMKKYMEGKALPFDIEDWHDIVVRGAGAYNDHGWRPMGTIITGWPDEKPEDVVESLELLDKMKDINMFFVPLLFIPLEDSLMRHERKISLDYLTENQWEFISRCWNYNIKNWAQDMRLLLSFAALASYAFYFRWTHGKKFFKPALIIAGLDSMIGLKVSRECDRELCMEADAN
jgi:radical SAM superfamily enzyme YgiQ (UPF0313 family)